MIKQVGLASEARRTRRRRTRTTSLTPWRWLFWCFCFASLVAQLIPLLPWNFGAKFKSPFLRRMVLGRDASDPSVLSDHKFSFRRNKLSVEKKRSLSRVSSLLIFNMLVSLTSSEGYKTSYSLLGKSWARAGTLSVFVFRIAHLLFYHWILDPDNSYTRTDWMHCFTCEEKNLHVDNEEYYVHIAEL